MRRSVFQRGVVHAAFRGGSTERFLNACSDANLVLWHIERTADGAVNAYLAEEDFERAQKIAVLCMCESEILSQRGGKKDARILRRRAGLLTAAAVFALLLTASSLFIWDIEVVGNRSISSCEILRTLADCGVAEGCFWPATDVEDIRSRVLLREDGLAWMTLNVRGSRATAVVLERREKPEIYAESRPADLVAACGGEITEMSVKNGRALVTIGQVVAAGDTLVSGRMESPAGQSRLVRAEGSVTADTWRSGRIFLCPAAQEKTRRGGVHLILGIKCGKARLNLAPKGRKDLDECDRISKEYKLGIKGVFAFPLALVVEEYRPYEKGGDFLPDVSAAEGRIYDALAAQIDGEIVNADFSWENGCVLFSAHCRENIATTRETKDP